MIYERVINLAATLDNIGHSKYSRRIQNAKLSGSTSSEVLGSLIFTLKEIKEENEINNQFVLNEINSLISEMANVLGFK